jgi:hypothetical protein
MVVSKLLWAPLRWMAEGGFPHMSFAQLLVISSFQNPSAFESIADQAI